MADRKTCPKCQGEMAPGSLREVTQYGGESPYVWAPADDAPFPLKGATPKRLRLAAYRCERCGYVEFYAVAPAG